MSLSQNRCTLLRDMLWCNSSKSARRFASGIAQKQKDRGFRGLEKNGNALDRLIETLLARRRRQACPILRRPHMRNSR